MKLSINTRQIIADCIWGFIFITSTIFLVATKYFCAASILYFLNLIIVVFGILITHHNKFVIFFNPIFKVFYTSVYYYTFMGLFSLSKYNNLYYLMQPPTDNETFLIIASLIIFFALFCVMLPTIISMFHKQKYKIKLKSLMNNYDYNKILKYLYYTLPILIILYFLLCISAGYTPVSAILNPAEFRNASNKDIANLVNTIYQAFLGINLCITMQLAILHNIKLKSFKIYLILFSVFCLLWGIFSGGRGAIVGYITIYFVIYSFKKNIKLNIKQLVKIIALILSLIIFVSAYGSYRIKRTQIANNQIVVENKVKNSFLTNALIRLDTYNSCLYYLYDVYKETSGEMLSHSNFKLKDILITQSVQFIPRRFFPNKLDDTQGEITKKVFPIIYDSDVHLVFGGVATLIFEGGIFWLILNALILGFIVQCFNINFRKNYKYDIFFSFYILFFMSIIDNVYQVGVFNSIAAIRMPVKFVIFCIVAYLTMNNRKKLKIYFT